jgi:hypothetical protein
MSDTLAERKVSLELAAQANESDDVTITRAQKYFAFLTGTATADVAKPAKPSKAKAAAESAPPAAPAAPAVATAPAAAPAAPQPEVPTPKAESVNKAVLALAGKNRDKALAVLAEFKVARTPELKPEQYQAVIDRMEEELAKLDAASVQASLV